MKTALLVLLIASPAFADPTIEIVPTCVTIDVESARASLVRALERQDRLIVEIGCEDTIDVSHEREGDTVIVHMRNAIAKRRLVVSIKDDMLDVYSRMARSLYEASEPATDPEPTLAEYTETMPAEQPSESNVPTTARLWYAQLGFGTLGGESGMEIALGWRFGSNRLVFDIAVTAFVAGDAPNTRTTSAFRARGLRYTRPNADSSAFFGGGMSLASTTYDNEYMEGTTGSGLRLDASAGWEWNRGGKNRYSIESNVTLPLYTVGGSYPATVALSFGVAR